jgi:branched-chain amino acid transport system permease protein
MLVLAATGFDFTAFFQQIENGITVGAVYALVALGYTLVYGIIELINFAHGDVFMWSTIVTLTVLQVMGLGAIAQPLGGFQLVAVLALLILVGMAVSASLNFTIEFVAYRRLRKAPRLAPLIAAIGASYILVNVALLWKSGNFLSYPDLFPTGAVILGGACPSGVSVSFGPICLTSAAHNSSGVRINFLDIFILILSLVLMYALTRFIQETKLGRAMRATAQDPEAASLMGVNINRTISTAFIIGGALAGAAGVVYSLYIQEARVFTGFQLGLIAFTAAVLGGIGNVQGAVLGGFMIGLIQSIAVQLIPEGFQWTNAIVFAVLVLVLVFRPSGLLGQQVPDKA